MRGRSLVATLVTLACLLALSCREVRDTRPPDQVRGTPLPEMRLKTLGEECVLQGSLPIDVEGFGLVVDLPGTGGLSAPREATKIVRDDLVKAGVPGVDSILASRDTCIVRVSGRLPALVRAGDKFDVRVEALGDARNVEHGLLLPARLKRQVTVGGRRLPGGVTAIAAGNVSLRMTAGEEIQERTSPLVGVITDGGTSEISGALSLVLRRPSTPAVLQVESAINNVYPTAATAEAFNLLRLHIPNHYRENPSRFFRVIQSMNLSPQLPEDVEKSMSDIAERLRAGTPQQKFDASCALEAYGSRAIPVLREIGRAASASESRMLALTALAHLDDAGSLPLFNLMARSNDPKERTFVARHVGYIRGPAPMDMLRTLVEDRDQTTAYAACVSLLESAPGPPIRVRRGKNLTLVNLDSEDARGKGVFIKNTPERRIALVGSNISLSGPFRISGYGTELIARDSSALLQYEVKGEKHQLEIRMRLEEVISTLDFIGIPFNEISYLVESLRRKGSLSATILYTDY